jgi:hypothetical protein
MSEKYSLWVEISRFSNFARHKTRFFFNNRHCRLPKSRFSIHENLHISAPRWSWKLIFGYVGGIYIGFEFFRWNKKSNFFWWKIVDRKTWKPDLVENMTWPKSVSCCSFVGLEKSPTGWAHVYNRLTIMMGRPLTLRPSMFWKPLDHSRFQQKGRSGRDAGQPTELQAHCLSGNMHLLANGSTCLKIFFWFSELKPPQKACILHCASAIWLHKWLLCCFIRYVV